jgi:fatty acid desaturase
MIQLPAISDPEGAQKTYNAFDRFWLEKIRDERDLPFIYLTLKITLIMLPLGILLFMPFIQGVVWWIIAAAYFYVNNFVFKGPFGLMLHCTSHRPWFKKKYDFANHYLVWVIGPFFGQTPGTYASHHIGMHHRENNLEEDRSSTMQYQRDSFRDFMRYFLDFFIFGVATTSQYFHMRKQKKLRNKVIRGEVIFLLVCVGLFFVDWAATVWVFVLPFVISRFIMMLGNWTQHSFVDPEDPGNLYKNSITCINVPYNHKCWNDGYHISHHLKPAMHWTEHPRHLKSNLHEYKQNQAIIFDRLDFLQIWVLLMRKNYQKLARHVVNIDQAFKSEDEVIALLRHRTAKIVS